MILNSKSSSVPFFTVRRLSWRWLAHARLDLCFPQSVAKAMALSPAQRPVVPVRRHHSGYWCNMRASTAAAVEAAL